MRRSIVRRVLQFIPVLLGITFLAFLLIYLSPSDPVSVRMSAGGISVSPEIMESMRRSMGLDRPLLVQYGDWLWNILHGNFESAALYIKNGGRFSFADPLHFDSRRDTHGGHAEQQV